MNTRSSTNSPPDSHPSNNQPLRSKHSISPTPLPRTQLAKRGRPNASKPSASQRSPHNTNSLEPATKSLLSDTSTEVSDLELSYPSEPASSAEPKNVLQEHHGVDVFATDKEPQKKPDLKAPSSHVSGKQKASATDASSTQATMIPTNPLEFMQSMIPLLKRREALTVANQYGAVVNVPKASLPIFIPSKKLRLRFEQIATFRGTTQLINLAVIDDPTGTLTTTSRSQFLAMRSEPTQPALFYLVGISTYCNLFSDFNSPQRNHQICVAISDLIWDRAVAVIGTLYNTQKLYFSTFQGGVSFATYMRENNRKDDAAHSSPLRGLVQSPVKQSPRKSKKKQAPSTLIVDPVLSFNAIVPVYDGTAPFKLSSFEHLPRITNKDIDNESIVMVLFTVSNWTSMQQPPRTFASMNIQHIILLSNPPASTVASKATTSQTEPKDIHPGVQSDTDEDPAEENSEPEASADEGVTI
ncbi:hypothetical protein A0H81_10153 [Grifola frondosa]|uniref:Uncharacterized protein n=1 Tax=Grifola frondosa TaxID=5627 RepID=A0A1C7M034_GRIFR|nr:hypothetical protein A0H81_10153 [Grifola frondosa]